MSTDHFSNVLCMRVLLVVLVASLLPAIALADAPAGQLTSLDILSIVTPAIDCPSGQFSVSVLGTPRVRCVSSPPCSGIFVEGGAGQFVGACPEHTSCGILPKRDNDRLTMRCMYTDYPEAIFLHPDGTKQDPTARPVTTTPPPPTPRPTNSTTNSSNTTESIVDDLVGADVVLAPQLPTNGAANGRPNKPGWQNNDMQDESKDSSSGGAAATSSTIATILEATIACAVVLAIVVGVYVLRTRRARQSHELKASPVPPSAL
ncbi:Aste57867_18815 [Aphanomyces stellatus]|uniref:Aste57867_18815 protein n=1 Tax=Aphanomyces stellatus TaxID=120398 RepID=A0A485LBE3_9STRA|nr:hypothetical protein As57867_018751 [Aphanomyces stellatus]VFT95549.1 Aste57867_18815 [Aphanomyces stellatus]